MAKEVLARDAAEAELQRFFDEMDLVFNLDAMDAEDQAGIKGLKEVCIRSLQIGRLTIDDKGQPVFTPKGQDAKPIVFREPTGADLMSMDMQKRNHSVAKSYAVMASQTRENITRFSKMGTSDLKVCQAISMLFLA